MSQSGPDTPAMLTPILRVLDGEGKNGHLDAVPRNLTYRYNFPGGRGGRRDH